MANTAAVTAANAEADQTNDPGYCLQQCRIWAGINSMYPDASTAWRNTNDRYPGNRQPPRGAAVYWTGGSKGYGHIAISLGGGNVRSTDAGGTGVVATRNLAWFDSHWPSLTYAGWAWDINEATIIHDQPQPPPEEDPVPDYLSAQNKKGKTLAPNEWYPIDWDDPNSNASYFNQGDPGIKIQGPYSASLNVDVTRTDDGIVQLQFIEFAGGEAVETNPIDAVGKVDRARTSQVGSVAKDRVLRARVRASKGGKLNSASIQLLVFRPK
jgi:hypothetical protein